MDVPQPLKKQSYLRYPSGYRSLYVYYYAFLWMIRTNRYTRSAHISCPVRIDRIWLGDVCRMKPPEKGGT